MGIPAWFQKLSDTYNQKAATGILTTAMLFGAGAVSLMAGTSAGKDAGEDSTPLTRQYERTFNRSFPVGHRILCDENTVRISDAGWDILGQAVHGEIYTIHSDAVFKGTIMGPSEASVDLQFLHKMRDFHSEARKMGLCHQPRF